MPTTEGKFYLVDFVDELKRRGFDGFDDSELELFVNRAYFAVAKKSRWEWERTNDEFTLGPGNVSVLLWPADGGELPNFRSLDRLYITTEQFRSKLKRMNDDVFFQQWLSRDLTDAGVRTSQPSHYIIFSGQLYILPPPDSSLTFLAYYHQRVTALVDDVSHVTDLPITPQHLDEAILDAARVRAHTRSSESAMAQLARADLEEHFDDMRDDEEEMEFEYQDRVEPDRTWL